MQGVVVIDCFPESVRLYRSGYAVAAIDVIRASTTAVTAVATGRRCFPAASIEAALLLRATVKNALLAGEFAGRRPHGFGMTNSPAELAMRTDIARPVILLSSSGTKLILAAQECEAAYVGCFRNSASLARHLAGRHWRVALIGAGSRGEFREEDQICCAWIAAELVRAGYQPQDGRTAEIIERWSGASPVACVNGKSADYLRRSGQGRDLDFVLTHVNDLDRVFTVERDEIVVAPPDARNGEPPFAMSPAKTARASRA